MISFAALFSMTKHKLNFTFLFPRFCKLIGAGSFTPFPDIFLVELYNILNSEFLFDAYQWRVNGRLNLGHLVPKSFTSIITLRYSHSQPIRNVPEKELYRINHFYFCPNQHT